jgi:hypothetical protein
MPNCANPGYYTNHAIPRLHLRQVPRMWNGKLLLFPYYKLNGYKIFFLNKIKTNKNEKSKNTCLPQRVGK